MWFALGWLAYRARGLAVEAGEAREEATLIREADSLAAFVGGWVDAQARTLEGWHRVWDLRDRDAAYRIGLTRAVYQAMDPVVTVALVDRSGHPVVRPQFLSEGEVPAGRVPGTDLRARAMLESLPAASPDGVAVGRPYLAPGSGDPVVAILAGAPDDPLRLAAEVSLHLVERILQGSAETAAILFDEAQEPIMGDAGLLAAIGGLREVLALGGAVSFRVDEGPVPVRGASTTVAFLPWTLTVLRPVESSEGVGAAIRDEGIRVALTVMLLLLVGGAIFDRTITRSVRQLTHHARRLRDGDHSSRSGIVRRDEIGELARAFDEMAEQLEASRASLQAAYDELAGFNERLQARVKERTRELEQAQQRLVDTARLEVVAEVGAGLAHEMNNPLAVILGQVELSMERGGADASALSRMKRAADRCRDVVATLRSLDQDGGGRREGTELVLTDEALGVASTVWGERVRDETAGGQAPARGDRSLLRQALQILMTELDQASGSDGEIAVRTLEGQVELEVHLGADSTWSLDDWRTRGARLWRARRIAQLAGVSLEAVEAQGRIWRLKDQEEM